MSPSSISKPTEPRTSIVPLRQLAHARAGDKGDICSIALFAYDPDLYELLVRTVTPPAVHEQFQHRRPGHIERYLLPQLHGMNLVLHDALDGGVNDSLNLDAHGKSLSFHLLSMRVEVPAELASRLIQPGALSTGHHPQPDRQTV